MTKKPSSSKAKLTAKPAKASPTKASKVKKASPAKATKATASKSPVKKALKTPPVKAVKTTSDLAKKAKTTAKSAKTSPSTVKSSVKVAKANKATSSRSSTAKSQVKMTPKSSKAPQAIKLAKKKMAMAPKGKLASEKKITHKKSAKQEAKVIKTDKSAKKTTTPVRKGTATTKTKLAAKKSSKMPPSKVVIKKASKSSTTKDTLKKKPSKKASLKASPSKKTASKSTKKALSPASSQVVKEVRKPLKPMKAPLVKAAVQTKTNQPSASLKKSSSFKEDYATLKTHLNDARLLESANTLLMWDAETHMPTEGIEFRSKLKALISELAHSAYTSKEYEAKLGALIDLKTGALQYKNTPAPQADALKILKKEYLKQSRLPASFVKEMSEVTSKSVHAWAKARKEDSFEDFLPHLTKIVALCRKKAEYLGYEDHPYDALLDEYEPGMTSKKLKGLFSELQTKLTAFIKNLKPLSQDCLKGHYPQEKQKLMGFEILKLVGLDPSFCRLDESAHPFCLSLNPQDIRLTTKYHEDKVMSSVGSVLHEAGHGLYEHNLPVEEFATPLGQACSLAIHESQSRLFEVFVGKSRPFWNYFYPKLQTNFHEAIGNVSLDEFYPAIHHASPSFIRVESDEVTYNLHIILRFELEMGLIEGSIQPKDIPKAWNEKMEQYLGIVPPSFAKGCLQDIHWSMGGIGYFPTYTLGNLAAASLFATYQKEHPNWSDLFEKGDLESVRQFVKEKIHIHGKRYSSQELLKQATGSDFKVDDLMNYLETKYAGF